MRKAVVALSLLLVIVMITAAVVVTSMIRRGFSTFEQPSRIETFIATKTRRWSVPSELKEKKNPIARSASIIAEGRAHFADHCANCHGNDGKGSALGKKMYPKAPDMTLAATQELSDGEIFAIIENGIRMTGMPGFGSGTAESAYGTWGLVHFIRHLPNLTPAELSEMQTLNPKSPAEWKALEEEEAFLSGGGESDPAPAVEDHSGHQH